MEKIYLLESGDYFLGIDSAAIVRIMDRNSCRESQLGDDTPLLLPASFFDQYPAITPESEFVVIEIVNGATTLFLLFDRIVEEIAAPQYFESIPLLYPDFARRCCPQIMTHDAKPVLLLDGAGLEDVRRQLGDDNGSLSLGALLGENHEEIVVEAVPVPPVIQEKIVEPVAVLDDMIFGEIVSWTIDVFLRRLDDTKVTLSVGEIPEKHIEPKQLQLMDKIAIQKIIDQTVQRCEDFYDASFVCLSNTITGVKS